MIHSLDESVRLFARLGKLLRNYNSWAKNKEKPKAETMADEFAIWEDAVFMAEAKNPWFTRDNLLTSLTYWGNILCEEKLYNWLRVYYPSNYKNTKPLRVGLVLAGNIPLVGFHDILSVLCSGNIAVTKLSYKDNVLYKTIHKVLMQCMPSIQEQWILLENEYLRDIDAIIATGSDNSSRYFESYFGKYPHIIRKNRNSTAVLTGHETTEEIAGLGEDVFRYFGLGCRNISKLYLPEGYDISMFYENIESYSYVYSHNKYANNYDYQKAVLLVNKIPFFDNGFLILKKDSSFYSPVGVLYYEEYKDLTDLAAELWAQKDKIQCIVSGNSLIKGSINPGTTQSPELSDYADGIDSLKFLSNL